MYCALFNGVMGSNYRGKVDQPSLGSNVTLEVRRRLTVFPIIRIRLLKVLRVKTGRASTERTGQLGAPDLILSIHISGYARKCEESVSLTDRTTRHRLGCLVNPKIFKSDKDRGHTGGGIITSRLNEVIKYLLHRDTIR